MRAHEASGPTDELTGGRGRAVALTPSHRAVSALLVLATVAAMLTVLVGAAPRAQAVTALPTLGTTRVCSGFSGHNTTNPYASVRTGLYLWGSHKAVRLFTPPANATSTAWGTPVPVSVAWTANPYRDVSWQVWMHSLKWLGALVTTGGGRSIADASRPSGFRVPTLDERWDALDLALGATKHYLAAHPKLTSAPTLVEKNSMGHRAQFLACLAETLGPDNTPSWLTAAIRAHAAYLKTHYAGAWNQGIEQDLGILTGACVVGPSSDAAFAVTRLGSALRQTIGADGVPGEQTPGYAGYQYRQWQLVLASLTACAPDGGAALIASIQDRTSRIGEFLAHATQPDGTLVQIGDSTVERTPAMPGTEFAASLGATGTEPGERVKIFSPSGFIFGRSSWTPFTTRSFYSLRFGPPVDLHGHADRTSVTWMVRGVHRIVDSGHVGYANAKLRAYLRSPEAHNQLTADTFRGFGTAKMPSRLLSSSITDGADGYLIDAQAYRYPIGAGRSGYTTQQRGALIVRGPDLLIVRDSAGGAPKPVSWRQHWHLPPGWTATARNANVVEARAGSLRTTFVRIPPRTGAGGVRIAASVQAPKIGVAKKNLDVQFLSSGRSTNAITVVAPVGRTSLSVKVTGAVLTVISEGTTVRIALNRDGTMTRLS